MLDFKDYCESKSIDLDSFKEQEPDLYNNLKTYFDQVHPDSFTAQKLFLLNELRRRHHKVKAEKITLKTKSGKTAVLKDQTPIANKSISKPVLNKPKVTNSLSIAKPKVTAKQPIIKKPILSKKVDQIKEIDPEKTTVNTTDVIKKSSSDVARKVSLKPKIPTRKKL